MKSRFIVMIVVMLLIGPLIWCVNDAWVDTSYVMEYSNFEVWLGEDNHFQKLNFSVQRRPTRHSPFHIRFSSTEPSFPVLELPEAYIAERGEFLSGHNDTRLSTENEGGNQRYYCNRYADCFDYQEGHLNGAMISSCEVRTDSQRGFNRLQGSREHVEACLGPPVRVQRFDNRRPLFKFGGP